MGPLRRLARAGGRRLLALRSQEAAGGGRPSLPCVPGQTRALAFELQDLSLFAPSPESCRDLFFPPRHSCFLTSKSWRSETSVSTACVASSDGFPRDGGRNCQVVCLAQVPRIAQIKRIGPLKVFQKRNSYRLEINLGRRELQSLNCLENVCSRW